MICSPNWREDDDGLHTTVILRCSPFFTASLEG
jgi:hypothetical protein